VNFGTANERELTGLKLYSLGCNYSKWSKIQRSWAAATDK